jgi:L-serine dehydratase
MSESSSVFDMIGPVMIGPSSSHTAGVVRIGRTVSGILEGQPDQVEIIFYNSFARTYEGHGSDRAIIAGLMDFATDDVRIKKSLELAKTAGLRYKFKSVGNASTFHPNTIQISASKKDETINLIGESRGGGVIRIKEIDGFAANFSTSLHTLIVTTEDIKGSIGYLANILSQDDCNIATMTVSRKGKNDDACQIIEMDSDLHDLTIEYIKNLNWVHKVRYIPVIDS